MDIEVVNYRVKSTIYCCDGYMYGYRCCYILLPFLFAYHLSYIHKYIFIMIYATNCFRLCYGPTGYKEDLMNIFML